MVLAACTDTEVSEGTRLMSIQYSLKAQGSDITEEWGEKIIYDELGRVSKVEPLLGLQKVESELYYTTYDYDNLGRLITVSYLRLSTDSLFLTQKFTYVGITQRLDKSFDSGYAGYGISTYNENEEVILTEGFNNDGVLQNKSVYVWENGNLVRVKSYSYRPEEFLAYEYIYEYDNKVNFKKNIPLFINDATSRSANNVIFDSIIDHSGLIDRLCNPCGTSYSYNSSGLPYKLETGYGRRATLKYE
jgi:hypothetical protein